MCHSAVADAPGVTVHMIGRLRVHRGLAPRGILSCREPGGCELSLISRRQGLFAVILRDGGGEEHIFPIPSWRPVPEDERIHLSIGIGVLARRLALVRLNVNGRTLAQSALAITIDPRAPWRERLGRACAGRAAAADLDVHEVRRIEMFLGSAWEQRLWNVYAGQWNLPDETATAGALPSERIGEMPVTGPGVEPSARRDPPDAKFGNVSPVWESA